MIVTVKRVAGEIATEIGNATATEIGPPDGTVVVARAAGVAAVAVAVAVAVAAAAAPWLVVAAEALMLVATGHWPKEWESDTLRDLIVFALSWTDILKSFIC